MALVSPSLRATVAAHRQELAGVWLSYQGKPLTGPARQSAYGTVHGWQTQGTVPLGALQACGLALPEDARVRLLDSPARGALLRNVQLTDELLWLLGLCVAEGSRVVTPPKGGYLDISCDEPTLNRATKILERDLGVHVARGAASVARAGHLVVNGRLVVALMDHLGFGPGPKCLPGWVLGLPLERLGHVLEGYREGDGVHSGKTFYAQLRHEFSTVSTALKDDLVVALGRFGLVPGVGRYESTIKAETGDRRYPFWRLTVRSVAPWSPLDWHRGVTQTMNARRFGDLVWSQVESIEPLSSSPLVFDFVVPGKENFLAGTAVMAHNTHGPRMRPNDGRAIPAFAGQALTGRPITVAGDGSQTRSIIYVDDLVEGIMLLLRSDLAGPVNIGNPCETSVLELAETIKRLTGSDSEIVFVPRPTDDPSQRQPDITLARRELGWEPQIGYEEGLRKTLSWFSTHPALQRG